MRKSGFAAAFALTVIGFIGLVFSIHGGGLYNVVWGVAMPVLYLEESFPYLEKFDSLGWGAIIAGFFLWSIIFSLVFSSKWWTHVKKNSVWNSE